MMPRSFLPFAAIAATLAAVSPAGAGCGDLWSLSEAAVSVCIGHGTQIGSAEHEAALRLMSRGDWNWTRQEIGDACELRIELEGDIDGTSYRIEHQCTIDDADALVACTNGSLSPAEEAVCHLRHIRS